AEELWHLTGNTTSVVVASFPEYDESLLVENTFEYPVSFNGKTRFKMDFPLDADPKQMEQDVLASPQSAKYTGGKQPKKVIVVKGKIINVVY
ncbi:MAG: leucine--tRNA ligase, partial [Prevotellaceae bacterium]|nr:leucine--tRNA ligase [Prevotellaceae bacterium]